MYIIRWFWGFWFWASWSWFCLASDLFGAIVVLGGTHQGGAIKGMILSRLAMLRPDLSSNWRVRYFRGESCLDWADLGQLLMIVLYNWPETIYRKELLASLSSLRPMESKVSISSAGSDVALNAPVIIRLAHLCMVWSDLRIYFLWLGKPRGLYHAKQQYVIWSMTIAW